MPIVPYHRFKVGQTVVAPIISGPSAIVRLLPVSGRDPQYQIRSSVDCHDRVVTESQIRLADQQPSIAEPPVRTERVGRRYRE
jgi:hypothetical protein